MRFGPSLWALPLALAAREARLASDARKPSDASGSRVLLQAHAELQRTNETQKETPFSALVEAAAVGHPVASSWSEHACAALGLLLTACLTVYLKFVVEDYEERATPKSPPWFCDEVIIFKVGSGVVLAWMLIGIVAFTRVLNFSVIGTVRKLDLLEAIYLCSEILTTVGYGDMSPTSLAGQAFCAAYSVVGCSIVAVVFSLLFNFCLGTQRQLTPSLAHSAAAMAAAQSRPRPGKRYKALIQTVRPLLIALASGTVFYSYYPGEGKTPWEAFYMSVQTLTTVGFGDLYPVTAGGRAFATVWMLLGVTAAANTIVTMTDAILKYRRELKAEHLTKELLQTMAAGSDRVTKSDFLCYELVRRGLCENDELGEILAFFGQMDSKKRGYLDLSDFTALVSLQSTLAS